jgi:hypothetical protein
MLMSVCAIIPRTRELAVEASTEEINNAFERARRAPRRSNLSAETNQLDMTARPAPILNHHAAFVIWLASLDLHRLIASNARQEVPENTFAFINRFGCRHDRPMIEIVRRS